MDKIQQIELLLDLKKFDQAGKLSRELISENPQGAQGYFLLAYALLMMKKFEEALPIIIKTLEISPENHGALYVAARIFLGAKKLNEAEKHIDAAINLSPEEAEYYAVKSSIYAGRFRWKTAEKWARKGLSIDPNNEYCSNILGFVTRQNDKSKSTKEGLEDALRRNPQNSYAHSNLGWFKYPKKIEEAKEHFLEALRLDPKNTSARRGFLFITRKDSWVFRLFNPFFRSKSYMPNIILRAFYAMSTVLFLIGFLIWVLNEFSILEFETNYLVFFLPYLFFFILMHLNSAIINPLSVLQLRLNPQTRGIFSKIEILGSNILLSYLSISLAAILGLKKD